MRNSYLAPHSSIFSIFLVYFFITFSFTISFAQTTKPTVTPTPEDDDIVKISTTLIQIDVTVTDKKGKIVTDLKPEDFDVYENGKKQTITNFSFVSSVPEAKIAPTPKPDKNEIGIPLPPVQIRPEQVRRTIALVVDDLGLSFESVHFVKRALKKFVDEQMQPNDLVAIIRTGSGMGASQQFTSDKNQLYSTIEKIRWNANGRAGVSAFAPIEPSLLEDMQAMGGEVSDEDIQEDNQRTKQFNEFREDIFSIGTLGAINFIVKGMGELPGRKSIMLFSDGFAICSQDNPDRCARMVDQVKQLTDLCNRAAVTIYTQDARGLVYTGITAADRVNGNPQAIQNAMQTRSNQLFNNQEGLSYLANETGGRAIFNNNDLNFGLEKMLEDTKGYYLIAYQPDSDTFDSEKRKFNKLEVKLNQKDYSVRYRSGFFGIEDSEIRRPAPQNQNVGTQMMKALSSPFGQNGIDLKLNALFGRDEKLEPFVRSFLHVDGKDLKFVDTEKEGEKKAVFDVLAVNFGENGVPVDQISKTYTLTVRGDGYKRILEEGFVYNFIFPIKKPGAYQMRVAIRDANNFNIGSANQFVEVPDLKKNKLILSGIVLENLTQKQWSNLQKNIPPDSEEDQPNPTQDISLRRFKRGTILRYGNEIYNAKLDKTQKPDINTKIRIFRDGKIILDGKLAELNLLNQQNMKRLPILGAIFLGDELLPGDYVLQIIAIDNLAKKKDKLSTQWIQFEIVD